MSSGNDYHVARQSHTSEPFLNMTGPTRLHFTGRSHQSFLLPCSYTTGGLMKKQLEDFKQVTPNSLSAVFQKPACLSFMSCKSFPVIRPVEAVGALNTASS